MMELDVSSSDLVRRWKLPFGDDRYRKMELLEVAVDLISSLIQNHRVVPGNSGQLEWGLG